MLSQNFILGISREAQVHFGLFKGGGFIISEIERTIIIWSPLLSTLKVFLRVRGCAHEVMDLIQFLMLNSKQTPSCLLKMFLSFSPPLLFPNL